MSNQNKDTSTKKRRKPRTNKQGLHECEFCGSTKNVSWDEDPFAADVYNCHDKLWICAKCAHESSMDI
jgi:hypothetical protein